MLEKTPTFNQLLEITISWCKEQLKDCGQIDQMTLFESVKGEWENRLLLWEEINPFVKETLNIGNLYPDEIAVRETVGGLCKKLAHKTSQPVNTENEKGAWNKDIVPIPPEKKIDRPTVFILSSPRSGSTLLRTMLAGHTELNAPPRATFAWLLRPKIKRERNRRQGGDMDALRPYADACKSNANDRRGGVCFTIKTYC